MEQALEIVGGLAACDNEHRVRQAARIVCTQLKAAHASSLRDVDADGLNTLAIQLSRYGIHARADDLQRAIDAQRNPPSATLSPPRPEAEAPPAPKLGFPLFDTAGDKLERGQPPRVPADGEMKPGRGSTLRRAPCGALLWPVPCYDMLCYGCAMLR